MKPVVHSLASARLSEKFVMETPQWLTSEFIQKILVKDHGMTDIDSYTVESATNPGDNYLSVIYRLTVKTKSGEVLSFIVKTLTDSSDSREFINLIQAFPKETVMYEEVLPQLEKLWKDFSGETILFGPRCAYTAREPLEIIVLQDLKPIGYSMKDRVKGLNLKATKQVLAKLAKFNASSVKLVEEVRMSKSCVTMFR